MPQSDCERLLAGYPPILRPSPVCQRFDDFFLATDADDGTMFRSSLDDLKAQIAWQKSVPASLGAGAGTDIKCVGYTWSRAGGSRVHARYSLSYK